MTELTVALCYFMKAPKSLETRISEHSIGKFQAKREGLKLNGTHQLVHYDDEVNLSHETTNIVKRNAEALIVASIGLRATAEKTKCAFMSCDQNARQKS